MVSDEQIATELAIYNTLIPGKYELSMTLFIELTSEEELRTWLPRLVGIESAIEIRLGAGNETAIVRAEIEPAHASQLTREDITASVHYLKARSSVLSSPVVSAVRKSTSSPSSHGISARGRAHGCNEILDPRGLGRHLREAFPQQVLYDPALESCPQ